MSYSVNGERDVIIYKCVASKGCQQHTQSEVNTAELYIQKGDRGEIFTNHLKITCRITES